MRKFLLLFLSSFLSFFSFGQFAETFEVFPLTQWITTGTGVTAAQNTTYYQEGGSSVQLTHAVSANGHLTMTTGINLSTLSSPKLEYWHIAALEAGFDYETVEYSTDGGTVWVAMPQSAYLGNGIMNAGRFDRNGYTEWAAVLTSATATPGTAPGTDLWKKETFDLSAYSTSTNFKIRYKVTADGSGNYFGLLLDNISITSLALAPLAGTYTINNASPTGGTNFNNFNDAITSLNLRGLNAAVTFNVSAGQTFLEDAPIVNRAGTSVNTIKFQKSGAGLNPVVQPTRGAGAFDWGLAVNGADYITFDGIDVSISTGTTVEYGYYIRNANATDGAQNITILNSSIILGRANTGSRGIFQNVAITPTNATGANSNNKYQNLTISNVYAGIQLSGNSSFPDLNTEVGTTTNATRNVIGDPANPNDIGNSVATQTYGIRATNQSAVKVYNNDISNITATTTTDGILIETFQGTSQVFNNKITALKNVTTTSTTAVSGIRATHTTTGTHTLRIYNNFISDLTTAYSGAATAVRTVKGIFLSSTGGATTQTFEVDHNSVRIDATGSATSSSTSFEIATVTGPVIKVRNNIFANFTSGQSGIAKHYTWVSPSATSIGNTGSVSNMNDLYISDPSNGFIGLASTDRADLPAWQSVAGNDGSSISTDPLFVSTNDLHISSTGSTQLESGGANIGITTDIDNQVRPGPAGSTNGGGTAPDMGADEFDGTPLDASPPSISYTQLMAACSTADRTLSGVTITDGSGVPTTGALVPRIYYQKNGGAWFSKPGTLSSGSGTNGSWSFTIVSADMGGVVLGDIVSYYIIAQDIVSTPNISSNPSGVNASNVNSVSGAPATPNSYVVGSTLSGPYNIGAAHTIKTLTAATDFYNSCPITGAVIFNLTDPSYPENFPITIGANSAASITNTLTIRPAAGNNVIVSGASTSTTPTSIFRLNGAKFVKIDGVNSGGANLTVENTSTVAGSAAIWISSLGAGLGATNNTIKGVTIKGGIAQNTATTTTYGIVIAGSALNLAIGTVAAGDDNDNNTIDSCIFSTVRYGIYTRGGSTTNPNLGTVIRNNIIGPTSFGAEEIGKGGIVVREEDGIAIIKNEIQFVGGDFGNTPTGGTDRVGIALGTDAAWPITSAYIKNAVVTRNLVHDIVEERTFAAAGIVIGGADGTNVTNNLVANNMIYNILANGTGGDQGTGIGTGAGKGDKIVFNSIAMSGVTDATAGSTAQGTSAFGINIGSTTVADLSVLNNVVYMDIASRTTTIKNACIVIPASYVWGAGVLNNNDWYINGSNSQAYIGALGGNAGTFYNTLSDWQTASAKDVNTISADPLFISPSDLHVASSSPLDLLGTPVVGVTTDFDAQTRDVSLPDIGADEININSCTGASGGTAVAANTTRCAGDSTTITTSGFSTGAGSTYQWQSSLNNIDFTDVVGSMSPASFNTRGLTAKTYFRLKVTCPSGTALAYSNTITIDVNPIPTVSITPTGIINLCAPSTQALQLSATSAASPAYEWQNNGVDAGGTGTSYTATTSGVYRLKVTNTTTGCSNTSAAATITISPQPSLISITPASAVLCSNTDPATLLTASGGTISNQLVFGSQTTQNTASTAAAGYPAPFSNYYGGTRHQFLVLASELTAAGFSSGSAINALNFPVVSLGNTFTSNQDFKVKVGHSSLSSLTAFVAGLATVYGPSTFTPTVGYNNALDFTSAFTWNGTDNVIIETTYSNNNAGLASDVVVMYNSPTSFQSALVYRADNVTAAAAESATSINFSYSARPDFTLSGAIPTSVTWSPTAGLFTNAAATTPYTGTVTNTVYARPTANTTYTATATSPATCTRTQTVAITNNCAVPVTLLNFKGERVGSINKLEWITLTEINNVGFELQRSADGANFSVLKFIETKAVGGNSTTSLTYRFDDVKPLASTGYYRLKQLDKDGKSTISKVVLIKGGKIDAVTFSSIYPNPVKAILNLVISSPSASGVKLIITDVSGKVVAQNQVQVGTGDNQFKLPVSNLASGSYFLKAICANGCEGAVQKFVKQ